MLKVGRQKLDDGGGMRLVTIQPFSLAKNGERKELIRPITTGRNATTYSKGQKFE
jgi:hypothetical protein